MNRSAARLLVLVLTAPSAAAQRRTWIVDKNGGGDFRQIDSAVNAANPGDRVVVKGQVLYLSFTLDKGLDVEAVDGAVVDPSVIRDIPAGQSARVSGFRITGASNFSPPPYLPSLSVQRCAGPVLLESLAFDFFQKANALEVSGCAALLILRSQIAMNGVGGVALSVRGSSITVQDSRIQGGSGRNAGSVVSPNPSGPGAPGLWAIASQVFAARTSFVGGDGGAGYAQFSCIFPPSAGATAVSTDGRSLFLDACSFTAGKAGYNSGICPPSTDGAAIAATGSPARVTSDCTIVGRTENTVVVAPLSSIASPGFATRGSPVTLTFSGPPQTLVQVCADLVHGYLPLPGIDGSFLLGTSAVPLLLLAIGANGSMPFVMNVPMEPGLADQFVFFQGVAFPPSPAAPSLTGLGDLRIR